MLNSVADVAVAALFKGLSLVNECVISVGKAHTLKG